MTWTPLVFILFAVMVNHSSSGAFPENLALNKPARQKCTSNVNGKDLEAHLANDEDTRTDVDTTGQCSRTCLTDYPWWSVDLGEIKNITHIVLTSRSPDHTEELQGFSLAVATKNLEPGTDGEIDYYEYCWWDTKTEIIPPGTKRTYVCDVKQSDYIPGRYLIVKSRKRNTYLTLCNVEAYVSEPRGAVMSTYRGCFNDRINNLQTYSIEKENDTATPVAGRVLTGYFTFNYAMTVELCLDICNKKGFKYAGLQYSVACFCGNDNYDQFGEKEACSMRCAGNNQEFCGNSWTNSVYNISSNGEATYMGCFGDSVDNSETYSIQEENNTATPVAGRALADYFTYNYGMTIQKCVDLCRAKGFKFAGLQYSVACFCGNDGYDRYGKKEPCNMKCAGNNQQFCGDSMTNSVYEILEPPTTPAPSLPITTDKR